MSIKSFGEDYKKVALSENKKVFTFIPDEAVTNPREFTAALFAYAEKNGVDLVVTKESMYPEFTIDGIEYTAERIYTPVNRVPVAVIRCSVMHPEDFEPDVPKGRKRLMKLMSMGWVLVPVAIVAAMVVGWENALKSWEFWVLIISVAVACVLSGHMWKLTHFNEKQ